jgi:hypothetical protein
MILNELNKKPVISFGLGKTELTVPIGETVRVWQNEMFNTSSFDMYHGGDRKANVNYFDIVTDDYGEMNIEVVMVNVHTKTERVSNKIKLIVV